MNQSYIPSSKPTSSGVGSSRGTAGYPEPPSRASTSLSTRVSDIGSDFYRSPSMGTFTSSLPSLSGSSSNISHPQHFNGLPARSPKPGTPPSQFPDTNFSTHASGTAVVGPHPGLGRASPAAASISSHPLSSTPSPPPPHSVPPARVVGAVGPVTPARKSTHALLHSQSQSRQGQQLQPPSSVRSKTSVAETPSGDLANFQLLKGSPLQSVVDLDTPTPSPRTPSVSSVSPADAQAYAYALASHAYSTERRFLPGSSISPSVGRAQRAVTMSATVKSSFYCRICGTDPCHEITATGCGHMFCHPCIVEEVRENARCPVCNAAVLLFALLKLDIS
jgi:Zinc finger, C3HC4 type (RING finger)